MTDAWALHDDEFRAVSALDAARRYEHFVKRICDWESLWTLDTGSSAAAWPHPSYATDARTERVRLADWLNDWLPRLANANVKIHVFPTLADPGLSVDALALRADLEAESKQY